MFEAAHAFPLDCPACGNAITGIRSAKRVRPRRPRSVALRGALSLFRAYLLFLVAVALGVSLWASFLALRERGAGAFILYVFAASLASALLFFVMAQQARRLHVAVAKKDDRATLRTLVLCAYLLPLAGWGTLRWLPLYGTVTSAREALTQEHGLVFLGFTMLGPLFLLVVAALLVAAARATPRVIIDLMPLPSEPGAAGSQANVGPREPPSH